jgi:hypothetical protein
MIRLMAIVSFTAAIQMAATPVRAAWETGVTEDIPLNCVGLPLAGADSIAIRLTPVDGSYGVPQLVGLKSGSVLWTKKLPKVREVNAAKFDVACEKGNIRLMDSPPGDSGWFKQLFSWDGKKVKWLSMVIVRED